MKYLFILVLLLLILSGCKINYQDNCKGDECVIKNVCENNSDCIVSCGCNCVSTDSVCPTNTANGECPIGGLTCQCINNNCEYHI